MLDIRHFKNQGYSFVKFDTRDNAGMVRQSEAESSAIDIFKQELSSVEK